MNDLATRALQERNGEAFDIAVFMELRERTRVAIHKIASAILPGMREEDGRALARTTLKELDLLRGWHGIHVRFGVNTLKNFGEASEPDVVLAQDDIFFIDIGPIWRGHEGDGGETFVVGNDPLMADAAHSVRSIFDATRDRWRDTGLSGKALYSFAAEEAERLGWRLNLSMTGHRLSDFPHAVRHKGPLIDADYTPSPALWMLEIQIRHPMRRFGAFYEDLLIE